MSYTSDPNRTYPHQTGFKCDACKATVKEHSLPVGWYRLAGVSRSKIAHYQGESEDGPVLKRLWHMCSTECLVALVAGSHLHQVR